MKPSKTDKKLVSPRKQMAMKGTKSARYAKGGPVHDDEAQDKKLIAKMMKDKGLKSGGKC